MPSPGEVPDTHQAHGGGPIDASTLALVVGTGCLIWYLTVLLVCAIGTVQLWRHYSSPPDPPAHSPESESPRVTIIRPVKGLEPSLYECLASTFRQAYPRDKLKLFLCVADRQDPSLPVLERLLHDFPDFDVELLVEDEDPELQGRGDQLGPNPKIRNMSRAYREADGDIVWIIDCNVWVGTGTCARMVDTLQGSGGRPNKFVHLLPLVVDTAGTPIADYARSLLSDQETSGNVYATTTSTANQHIKQAGQSSSNMWQLGGGRLEESFMSSAHAKFYTAINTVLIAPCIVGKSTMFRRSHLDSLTQGQGIDFFSENICEDHLIGDLLWKKQVPEQLHGETWGNHAMVFGDLAIQPMAGMSVGEYIARRVRWLRVRKFTVTLATLVEPGTECFLCSLYGAYAFTSLPTVQDLLGSPPKWIAFAAFWFMSVCLWAMVDWMLYSKLHSSESINVDENTPAFARPPRDGRRRPFLVWLASWLGRETLAFPIWAWAVFGGVTVVWRGRRFWVGLDMRVHEIEQTRGHDRVVEGNGHRSSSKARME